MGPSHDNLFVGYTEDQFFNRYNGLNPELYMVATLFDHCIGATSSAREGFIQFIHAVNSCHSPPRHSREVSDSSDFFYQCFSRKQRSMHQCVLQSLIVFCRRYLSSLPSQDKNSILFSHFPILHRLCGDDTDFLKKREALSKQAITSINKLVDNYVTAGKGRSNISLTLAFQPITQ